MSFDTYMKFEGGQKPAKAEGESKATGHEKEIEIYSFSWGASNPVSAASSGGQGLSAGRVSVSSFNVMKKLDTASAPLFQSCCNGNQFDKVTVSMRKASGDQIEFLKYEFEQVMVESIQWSGSTGGDDTPTESLSLAFGKVSITYSTVDGDGKPQKAGQASWDIATVASAK